MTKPFCIPETVKAIKLLDDFKKRQIKMGVVVNEYGETHGIITIQDISDNVLGDFPDITQDHQPQLVKREDGSLLVDGDYQFDEIMGILKDTRRVVFVNARVPRQWQDPNNTVLADGVKRYPNAVLVDWSSASANHPEYFWDDGIHLRPEGATVYAGLIAAAINAP